MPYRTNNLKLVAFALLFVPASIAQTFDNKQQLDQATSPSDLHLRLSAADAPRAFHIGEHIPIALEFWSDSPAKYKLNGATYDRGGRLPTEEFVLERNDIADPYADYFDTGILGGPSGGLRSNPDLDANHYRIDLNLNDWLRFDRAGSYRLYLKSHRVSRKALPGESSESRISFAPVSNIMEIRILPDDPAWTAAKLRELESILAQPEPEQPQPGGPGIPYNPLEEKLQLARVELRYLATPEAVRLSINDARKLHQSPDTLMLVGARDRLQTIASLDAYFADPQTPIREEDIELRALFTMMKAESLPPLPMALWQLTNGIDMKAIEDEAAARQKRFEGIARDEAIRLIPLALLKKDEARKMSANAIAALAPEAARASSLVPPDDYGLTRSELITKFAEFPVDQQAELLGHKWDLIRGADMIPSLGKVIANAPSKEVPDDAVALRVWGNDHEIATAAVRRLYELAPEEANLLVSRDLASGQLKLAGFAVRELPSFEIPEADDTFSQLLAKERLGVLPLIAKFSTVRLANQMLTLYRQQSWPCGEEASFLTYFVRTFSKERAEESSRLLSRAMADRASRGCYVELLSDIAEVAWNPVIEAQAISSLDDPDVFTVITAARVLAEHGSPAAEPFLWKRLERWSRDRMAEPPMRPGADAASYFANNLELALFRGIASATAWLLDEPRAKRLIGFCADDECRRTWARSAVDEEVWIEASDGGDLYPTAFRLAGYKLSTLQGLKEKLQQFPGGTAFRWCPQSFNPFDTLTPGQRSDMFQDLKAYLSGLTMRIEPFDEDKCRLH